MEKCVEDCVESPKYKMVAIDGCGNCATAKEILTRDKKMGKVEVIQEGTEAFNKIVKDKNISEFPTFITEDDRICNLTGTTEEYKLECKDGSEEEI